MASKYRKYERKEIVKKETNPIWRGVGCILFIVVPLLSYFLMTLAVQPVLDTGKVPQEVITHVQFPPSVAKIPVLNSAAAYISTIDAFWLKLILFAVIALIMITVTSLIWTIVQGVIGPPRYTEMDAPEAEIGAKRYTR